MKRPLIGLAAGLLLSAGLPAATLNDPAQLLSLSKEFITLIAKKDTETAYARLKNYVIASEKDFEKIVKQAVGQSRTIESELGESTGQELIRQEKIGESFRRHTWLIKYPQAALVWNITYYQADQGWKVLAVNFNTDLEPLYETIRP